MPDGKGEAVALTIPAVVARSATTFADRLAIVDGDVRLTYAALRERARAFAAALVASGVQAGDRVAIWAPNSVEWVVAAFGLWHAGAVLVPVNTRFKGAEATDILRRSGTAALVTVTDFLGTDYVALLDRADLPALHTVVIARGPVRGGIGWAEFLDGASADSETAADAQMSALSADDVSDILFTSGTTGAPKGVVQTHRGTLQVASDWVAMTGLRPGDRYLMVNPYFHMFGLKAGILASLIGGVTMLPQPVFDVDRVLARIVDEQVTVLPGAPTLYQSILDHPGRAHVDLSSLRVAVTGAADIPVDLIRRVLDELPFPTIIAGYGLTEGGTATATSADDDPETIATTVGRPRPGFEVRIVDREGRDVPTGEAGEILLRSGSLMSHYLDDPAATAQVMSADGWLRTGDLGTLTAAGCLKIVGRVKDMLIVGGFNAYPAEIEERLRAHPAVADAAVIGMPDRRLGEVPVAFVVITPGLSAAPEDIVAWAREQMANYKAPRRVEIVDELPRNATGKVMKEVLRQRL